MSFVGTEQTAFVLLIRLYNIWLNHLNCQHIGGHKSSTEAEMYCESTAWGRAARALRHPPTLPESAVSVATRAEGGGGRCALKVKRQTFEIQWEKHEGMGGWMGGQIYWKMGDKGLWQGQWGSGDDSSTSQPLTDWQSEANNSSILRQRPTGGDFSLSMAAQITVMAQGFKLDTDNVSLWNVIRPYGPIQSLVFLCPVCKQIAQAWNNSCQIKTLFPGKLQKEVKLNQQVVPRQEQFWTDLLIPCGKHSWAAITHSLSTFSGCNSTSDKCHTLTWRRRRCWNRQSRIHVIDERTAAYQNKDKAESDE